VLPKITPQLDRIFGLMPFDTHQRAILCRNRYNPSPSIRGYRDLLRLYRRAPWKPWEREHLDFTPNLRSPAFSIFIYCQSLLQHVFETLNIRLDGNPDFMEVPVEAVASYYGVELSDYIFNGKSLDDYWNDYIGRNDVIAYYELHRVW
jgi:hypothetical protein